VGLLGGLFGQPRIRNGIAGEAVVMAIPMASGNATSYRVEITLSVRVPDREPYLAKHTCFAKRDRYPMPGTMLPVTVDPEDPERLRIEWDRVPSRDERVAQQHATMLAAGGETPGGVQVIDVAQLGDRTAAPADPVDRLAKLVQLRDAGVVTPEQFEALKARILGERS
jgi:hypothetical protein